MKLMMYGFYAGIVVIALQANEAKAMFGFSGVFPTEQQKKDFAAEQRAIAKFRNSSQPLSIQPARQDALRRRKSNPDTRVVTMMGMPVGLNSTDVRK